MLSVVRFGWQDLSVAVKTLNLPDELWELLDTEAAREERSRSKMAARLLVEALENRRGRVSVRAVPTVPQRAAEAWPVTDHAKVKPARKGLCPHRIGPEAYCRECDG